MAIYVYRIADGSLYSYCPTDDSPVVGDDELATVGLAALKGIPALDDSHAWDPATKTIVSVTPLPAPKPIGTGKWIMRFTPQEFQGINTSTDLAVQQLMYALNHTTDIDLSDPLITNGVAYLVSINLLQQARIAAILG